MISSTILCSIRHFLSLSFLILSMTRYHLASASGCDRQRSSHPEMFAFFSLLRLLRMNDLLSNKTFLFCVVKNTTFVVGVVELGAIRTGAPANVQKDFPRAEHAQRRCYEVNPNRMPVAGSKCGTEGSRGVHTHPG